MANNKCPVCLRSAERGRDRDYGERMQVNCPRCGPFEISRTALAMLQSCVEKDPLSRARLSHAIRSATTSTTWFFVSSINLPELVQRSLPGINEQLTQLLRWLAAKLSDDHFGRI